MPPRPPVAALRLRIALLLLAAAALVTGMIGGLSRVGVPVPAIPPAIAGHGALMVAGFFGTVITLERAVAVGGRLALVAPLLSALAAVALLAGRSFATHALLVLAPLGLTVLSCIIVRRQRALHTVLLMLAALAWLTGDALYVTGFALDAVVGWWFMFLVATITAERLELTRLMPRKRHATPLLLAAMAALLGGTLAMTLLPRLGYACYGASLLVTALWLVTFDVARRTVAMTGFARYAAVALLTGYVWLAAGAIAWALLPVAPLRDLALHAIGLGFVLSMVFAHAPVVVPVIARRPLRYTAVLYVPLVLLHVSLLLRVGAGSAVFALRQWGAALNVLVVGAFAAALMYAMFRRAR